METMKRGMVLVAESRKYSCGVRIAELIVVVSFVVGLIDACFDFALVHGLASSQSSLVNGAPLANLSKEAGWLGICTCISLCLRISLTGYLFKNKPKLPQASYRSMLTWYLMFSGPAAFCIEDSTTLVIMSKLSLPQIAVPWIDQQTWEMSVNATLAGIAATEADAAVGGGRRRLRRDDGYDESSGSGDLAKDEEIQENKDFEDSNNDVEESVVGIEQFVFFNTLVGSPLVSGGNWTGIRVNHILTIVSAFLSAFGIFWVVILLCGDESSEKELDEEGTYVRTDEVETAEAEEFAEYINMDHDDEVFQCCVMLLGFVFIIVPAFVLAGVVCMWVWFAVKSIPSGSLREFADDDVNELGLGLGAESLYQLNPDEISWDVFFRKWSRASEDVDFEAMPIEFDNLELGLGYSPIITAYAFGWLFTFLGSFTICCCVDVGTFDPDLEDLETPEDGYLSPPNNDSNAASWDTSKWNDEAGSALAEAEEAARAAALPDGGTYVSYHGGSGGGDGGGGRAQDYGGGIDGTKEGEAGAGNVGNDRATPRATATTSAADEIDAGAEEAGYQLASATPVAGADAPHAGAGYALASATSVAETAIDEILPARIERAPTIKLTRSDTTASKI